MNVDVEAKLAELGDLWNRATAHVDVGELLGRDSVDVGDVGDVDEQHGRGADTGRGPVRSRWLLAVAATLVVVLVAALVWMAGNDDSPPSEPSDTTELPGTRAARAAWAPAGQLNYPCGWCWAGLLDDGRVVVTGGIDEQSRPVIELWDPVTATFTVAARAEAAVDASYKSFGGDVLVDGRVVLVIRDSGVSRVSVFDPREWTITELAELEGWVASPVGLDDGRALVFGNLASAERVPDDRHEVLSIDVTNGSVSTVGEGRGAVAWVGRLSDGRVAVVLNGPLDEGLRLGIFDPATGEYAPSAQVPIVGGNHTWEISSALAVLADGGVLVIGTDEPPRFFSQAGVFDPSSGELTPSGLMAYPHAEATAVRLADGRVLVIGDRDVGVGDAGSTAEIYDPGTGLFSTAPAPLGQRRHPAAVVLDANRILVIGDQLGSSSSATAEVLALDGDAGLPAGCCPPATRDVEVYAEFDPGALDVPGGGRVEAVIDVPAPLLTTDPPAAIRATVDFAAAVDVEQPAECAPYVEGPMTTCELIVPLEPGGRSVWVVFTFVGEPWLDADEVTVSFRVADEDDD